MALALLLAAAAAAAASPTPSPQRPELRAVAAEVKPAELHATVEALVGFGTRHTLSGTQGPSRGIAPARDWTASRFAEIARACGGCLEVARPSQRVTGARMPKEGAVVEDVLAIQRGTTDPGRVVVISAHIDSRVTEVMNATADAPGANDDGSGVAAVIEAARVLSRRKFPATVVYAVLSGEEQGLLGGKVLADHARAQGWRVEAVLNNDIVGNTTGQNGARDDRTVRVFSEGTKSTETFEEGRRRRGVGGEMDSPSRNLSRWIEGLSTPDLRVRMIARLDRYGRGGDQTPMLEAGFPAVRLTESVENWDRQHQDLRPGYGDLTAGVDFAYLAKVTRLNAVALAALAWAPPPPEGVKVEGALKDDTTVTWAAAPGAARYRVWWRDSLDPRWTHSQDAGAAATAVVKDRVVDDWLFGVQAISAEGWASPVVYPGAAGSFVSAPPPPKP